MESRETPWYVSSGFLLFAVVFLTPAWIAIKLARPGTQRITVARIALSLYGFLLAIFINDLLGHPLSSLFGPAEIEFGSKYVEAPGQVSLVDKRSSFSSDDLIAWVVYLKTPVEVTSVDLAVSKVTKSGGDLVLSKSPIFIADPSYNILFGHLNPLILVASGTGRYRVYITRADKILARGELDVAR